jgi:DsbC/DsbD-like thiol-disulfide interchange protein
LPPCFPVSAPAVVFIAVCEKQCIQKTTPYTVELKEKKISVYAMKTTAHDMRE